MGHLFPVQYGGIIILKQGSYFSKNKTFENIKKSNLNQKVSIQTFITSGTNAHNYHVWAQQQMRYAAAASFLQNLDDQPHKKKQSD